MCNYFRRLQWFIKRKEKITKDKYSVYLLYITYYTLSIYIQYVIYILLYIKSNY